MPLDSKLFVLTIPEEQDNPDFLEDLLNDLKTLNHFMLYKQITKNSFLKRFRAYLMRCIPFMDWLNTGHTYRAIVQEGSDKTSYREKLESFSDKYCAEVMEIEVIDFYDELRVLLNI